MVLPTVDSSHKNPAKKPRLFYGYIIVFAAFLMLMMGWGIFYIYGVFFNPLSQEFGWTRAVTSGAFSICILMSGGLGIIAGRLSDRFGPRIVLFYCTIFLGLGYFLMSFIQDLWQFYLVYGLFVAAGISGFWAPAIATVSRWFVKKRGMMTGIVSGGISFGTLVLPPLVTHLISAVDWRITYIIIGATVLMVDFIVLRFFRSDPRQMGLLPLGASAAEFQPHLPIQGFSLKLAMKTRQFWMVCLIYLCFGVFQLAVMVHIVPYAQDIKISAISAAGILSIVGGVSLAARIIIGTLTDKLKVRVTTILCLVILVTALTWLQFADNLWKLYLFAVVFGFGYGGLSCLQALIAAELFGLVSMGVITAVFSFSFNIGGAVGPVMAGYLFDSRGSYRWAFLICVFAAGIAFIISLFVKPPHNNLSSKS